jgi:hypothetical protein
MLEPHLCPQDKRSPDSLVKETLGYGHTSGMERIKCGEERPNRKKPTVTELRRE